MYQTNDNAIPEVLLQSHGSILIFWPRTERAKAWFNCNIFEAQYWGEGIVCEPRYVSGIVEGLEADGFTVG